MSSTPRQAATPKLVSSFHQQWRKLSAASQTICRKENTSFKVAACLEVLENAFAHLLYGALNLDSRAVTCTRQDLLAQLAVSVLAICSPSSLYRQPCEEVIVLMCQQLEGCCWLKCCCTLDHVLQPGVQVRKEKVGVHSARPWIAQSRPSPQHLHCVCS